MSGVRTHKEDAPFHGALGIEASLANDLGFTESTVAALVGHSTNSITSKYIHSLDSVLIAAADTVAGYIQSLLDGAEFRQTALACDRVSRKTALDQFIRQAALPSE